MTPILGIGSALPPLRIDRDTAADYARTVSCTNSEERRKLGILYRRTGIGCRGSVLLERRSGDAAGDGLSDGIGQAVAQSFYPPAVSEHDRGPSTECRNRRYEREAPPLALAASAAALRDSQVSPGEITHLITVTCTGFSAPGIDISLIDDLSLPPHTERIQVGFMGCHAAINGLRVARGLIAAEPASRVLLCSVELCSLHYQYGFDVDRIVSGALFADGAGALVLGGESADAAHSSTGAASTGASTNPGNGIRGELVATGSYLVPESRDAMTWRIGDHGYEMTLSAKVPDVLRVGLRPFLSSWLDGLGESIESIGGWAVHPGGGRILTAVEQALALPGEALATPREVLSEHGNMSSATMPIILESFAHNGQAKPWLMLGFGPGLEIEVALIR